MGSTGGRQEDERRVDDEGQLISVPVPLSFFWLVLLVFTILEAANDLFGVGGPAWLYENWFHNAILASCAFLVLGRAVFEPVARRAWLAFGTLTFAVVCRERCLECGVRGATRGAVSDVC